MKAYDKRKCLFCSLTLDEFDVTQGQGIKCQFLLFKPLIIIT